MLINNPFLHNLFSYLHVYNISVNIILYYNICTLPYSATVESEMGPLLNEDES